MDKTVGNPYDFGNPVIDPQVFAGRKVEIQTIRYYLDEAKRAPRPFNLAIIGPRGSGKTSILNMVAFEATERHYIVVRVNLDEGDAVSPLAFLFRIVNGLITTLAQEGFWGGTQGATFEQHLNMITTNTVPVDKTYCPFLYPIQYASAMSALNPNAPVSDQLVEHDLSYISETAARPIVLLFDECNVLGTHRILLEKLRNLFMNTPGYMLCLAGTEELFPAMNDVFSPIARQFKKIHVAEFTNFDDTKDCVELPLERAGLVSALPAGPSRRLFEKELHELTGGRPYEIQLVCHKCFRRLQQGDREKMILDATVLEDVRSELETTQDMSKRTALRYVDRLSSRHLLALDALGQCTPPLLSDRLWQTEYLFNGNNRFTRDTLTACLEDLVSWGVLSRNGTLVAFAGDDFDRIYLKYYGLERGLKTQMRSVRPDFFFSGRLAGFLRAIPGTHLAGSYSVQSRRSPSLSEISQAMAQEHVLRSPLDSLPYTSELYRAMFTTHYGQDFIETFRVTVTTPWVTADACVFPETLDDGHVAGTILESIKELENRSEAAGANVTTESYRMAVLKPEKLRELAEAAQRPNVRSTLALFHFNEALDYYLEVGRSADRPRVQTWFHAGIATSLIPDWPLEPQLALAYMISTGPDKQLAERLLRQITEKYSTTSHSALAIYDLSVIAAEHGETECAITLLSQAETCLQSCGDTDRLGTCTLQLLSIEQGRIIGTEVDNIELPAAIARAREVLSATC